MDTTDDAREEPINAATHALGLACAVPAAVFLIVTAVRQGGPWQVWGCVLYAIPLIAVYAVSTLSHLFDNPRLRQGMRVADQAIIFLFISASFTPVAFTWLRDGVWWLLIAAMWTVSLAGFASKTLFRHNIHLGSVSTNLYLILGWMPVIALWHLIHIGATGVAVWIFAGGLCYTFGTIFFHLDRRIPYFHAAWHLMVIAGSTCHYLAILLYCTRPIA